MLQGDNIQVQNQGSLFWALERDAFERVTKETTSRLVVFKFLI